MNNVAEERTKEGLLCVNPFSSTNRVIEEKKNNVKNIVNYAVIQTAAILILLGQKNDAFCGNCPIGIALRLEDPKSRHYCSV